MNSSTRYVLAAIAALIPAAFEVSPGLAQTGFPSRPIRIVVPYGPGSVTDVFARIVGDKMAPELGGTIIVESKSGANGTIAAEEVARAEPDGHTWLLATTFFVASPGLYPALRWNPVQDFIGIGQICKAPNFFVVSATSPVKNVADFVKLAKEKPGALNYGHTGKGSSPHLGYELFKRLANIEVTAVSYRSFPQMAPDIATGLINSSFLTANQTLAQVQAGSIRVIGAVTAGGRSKYFPDAPTIGEQGYAEAQVTPWFGIVIPAKTPAAIADKIGKALETALGNADIQQKLDIAGCEPAYAPRKAFEDTIAKDVGIWTKVIKDADITAD